MTEIWALAALRLGLALFATLPPMWLRIAMALSESSSDTTLPMSTGLAFGTISSLFGLSHGIIDQPQYSALIAAGEEDGRSAIRPAVAVAVGTDRNEV